MEIKECGAEDDEDEFRRAPTVEEDAEEKDGYVLELLGNQVIRDQKSRQESEKENDAAEYHINLIIGAEDKESRKLIPYLYGINQLIQKL